MIFAVESAAACLLFTVLVVTSLKKNPLAWISDFPPAIRQRAMELGLEEKEAGLTPAVIARKLLGCVAAAVLLALLLVHVNGAESFRQGFFLSYGLWLVVDWYDALVLDCLWARFMKKAPIPGTQDLLPAYRDYGFHIRMSAIGMVLGLPVCLLAGWLVALL